MSIFVIQVYILIVEISAVSFQQIVKVKWIVIDANTIRTENVKTNRFLILLKDQSMTIFVCK